MPPDEISSAYLHDMLKAARLAFAFIRLRTAGDLLTDPMLMAALEREVQIVGEAARKIEESFKEAHADVPWRKIIATRHILVHDYDDVDHEVLWRIATVHLVELIPQLEKMLGESKSP